MIKGMWSTDKKKLNKTYSVYLVAHKSRTHKSIVLFHWKMASFFQTQHTHPFRPVKLKSFSFWSRLFLFCGTSSRLCILHFQVCQKRANVSFAKALCFPRREGKVVSKITVESNISFYLQTKRTSSKEMSKTFFCFVTLRANRPFAYFGIIVFTSPRRLRKEFIQTTGFCLTKKSLRSVQVTKNRTVSMPPAVKLSCFPMTSEFIQCCR